MQSGGLILCSKAMAGIQKLFCGSKHISRFIDKAAFGGYNKRIDAPRTSSDWLSRNPENVDRYIADELCGFTFTVNGFQTLFELDPQTAEAGESGEGTAEPANPYGIRCRGPGGRLR